MTTDNSKVEGLGRDRLVSVVLRLRALVAKWRAADTSPEAIDPGYAAEDYWQDRYEGVLADLEVLLSDGKEGGSV